MSRYDDVFRKYIEDVPNLTSSQQFIRFAVDFGIIQFGRFTLGSGRVSPYMFDVGRCGGGVALALLGFFYARTLVKSDMKCTSLHGPAYKGIPLVIAISIALATEFDYDYAWSFNRKEPKAYAEGRDFIGSLDFGSEVIIVDDAITSGKAVRNANEFVRDHNALCNGVLLGFDRMEREMNKNIGALSVIQEELAVPVVAISTVVDLMEYLQSLPSARVWEKRLDEIYCYHTQYGV